MNGHHKIFNRIGRARDCIINQNIKHSVPFVLWVAQSVEQIKLSKLFFAFEAGQRAGAAQDGV
jgi:hypothetical protein